MKTRKRAKPVRLRSARAFEILVAQIEAALASKGVRVESPDRIKDVRTGGEREVDASLRYTLGSTEILVTIECRDRSRVQDVTWIEQLHSKQQVIRASKTVAVSSRSFSEAAKRAADELGIETGVLSEITELDVARWAAGVELAARDVALSDMAIAIETWTGDRIDGPTNDWLCELVAMNAFEARFLSLPDTAELRSPLSVLRSRAAVQSRIPDGQQGWVTVTLPPKSEAAIDDPGYQPFMLDVPDGGTPVQKEVPVEFDGGAAFIRWGTADWEIRRVILRCTARCIGSALPSTRTLRYESPDGAVAEVSQRILDIAQGKQLVMSSVRRAKDRKDGDDAA